MKTNHKEKMILLGLIVLTMLYSCRYVEEWIEEPHGIMIHNATDDTICIYVATGYYGESPTAYPDTVLPLDKVYWKDETISNRIRQNEIAPHSSLSSLPILDKKMNPIFSLPNDTLSIFFISTDTLNKYGYDMVREKNMILERHDLSMEEIKELYNEKKAIVYPR